MDEFVGGGRGSLSFSPPSLFLGHLLSMNEGSLPAYFCLIVISLSLTSASTKSVGCSGSCLSLKNLSSRTRKMFYIKESSRERVAVFAMTKESLSIL